MGVTQKEVAERAGVSRSVVSHVMHGGARTIRVSQETAELVRRIAQELGYQPSAFARNFRRQKTGMIGVLHGDGMPRLRFSACFGYFATLMDGIVDGAFENGYTVGMCPDLFGPNPEKAMADGRFDGFIWYNTLFTPENEARVLRCAAPMVFLHVESKSLENKFPTVICDNESGIRLAVDHLRQLGHLRISFMTNEESRSVESDVRLEILQRECEPRGMQVSEVYWTYDLNHLLSFMDDENRPTAIIAHSDQYAFDVVSAAALKGVRVPKDLSIVGFDSTEMCNIQTPPLTSISQPLQVMGETAVDVLVKTIEGRYSGPVQTVVPCGLDIRGSTAPPAKRR